MLSTTMPLNNEYMVTWCKVGQKSSCADEVFHNRIMVMMVSTERKKFPWLPNEKKICAYPKEKLYINTSFNSIRSHACIIRQSSSDSPIIFCKSKFLQSGYGGAQKVSAKLKTWVLTNYSSIRGIWLLRRSSWVHDWPSQTKVLSEFYFQPPSSPSSYGTSWYDKDTPYQRMGLGKLKAACCALGSHNVSGWVLLMAQLNAGNRFHHLFSNQYALGEEFFLRRAQT